MGYHGSLSTQRSRERNISRSRVRLTLLKGQASLTGCSVRAETCPLDWAAGRMPLTLTTGVLWRNRAGSQTTGRGKWRWRPFSSGCFSLAVRGVREKVRRHLPWLPIRGLPRPAAAPQGTASRFGMKPHGHSEVHCPSSHFLYL